MKQPRILLVLALLGLIGGALFVSNSSLSSAQPEPESAKFQQATCL